MKLISFKENLEFDGYTQQRVQTETIQILGCWFELGAPETNSDDPLLG